MIGSEKQIKWATEIKNSFVNTMQKEVDNAKRRSQENTMPLEFYQVAICVQNNLLEKISKWIAKDYIENRKFLDFDKTFYPLYNQVLYSESHKQNMLKMYKKITKNINEGNLK